MTTYCGYIALVGRPNVGKSTLLNRILEQKLSITSRKPQTTRHRILGIRTEGDYQYVYVDTPGIHQDSQKTMNRIMNKTAVSTLREVDAVAFIIDGTRWQDEDNYVLNLIKKVSVPCFLVINKVDKMDDKSQLLPCIEQMNERHAFTSIIPLSAKTGLQVDVLHEQLQATLPEGPHLFDADQYTDRPIRFLCAEMIREKIFRLCGQELPYSTTVDIESYQDDEKMVTIHALILVERENHKRMIIGEHGSKLKDMATNARMDMEQLLGKKVFLKCWCKVKSGWSDNARLLKQLGYEH